MGLNETKISIIMKKILTLSIITAVSALMITSCTEELTSSTDTAPVKIESVTMLAQDFKMDGPQSKTSLAIDEKLGAKFSWSADNVACVREWVANIFFYRKGDTTIMIDAGYNYDRLAEKRSWLGIDPHSIRHILITHQDTDHVGAVEADSPGLFQNAKLYISEIENRYLTGEVRRRVIYHLYKLLQVTINNEKVLLHDGEVFDIDGIRIECFLVPGHTWGHMVYLVDGKYLFTGDTIWFGADGGYSFISALAEDNKLAVKSLALLEKKLKKRGLHPLFITGHTGWTDNMEFAFAHKNELCSPFKKRVHDPNALYDAYDESDDTEENSKNGYLKGVGR